MRHPKTEYLSAFLEGDLPPERARELERHLDGCERCGSILRDLRHIQRLAEELPGRTPPRDLWPGIAAAIQTEAARKKDIIRLFPGAGTHRTPRRRTFRISIPQAVAAGLALAAFSGVLGARLGESPAAEPSVAQESATSWVSIVGEASPDLEGFAREVAEMEAIFARYREDLDPGTAAILEKNLRVIDRAIQESVQALRDDPGNRFLKEHLEQAIFAKGEYLRDAALLIGPLT